MPNNTKRYFYASIWNKYLPVIRILVKKSATGEQVFNMNRIDFERAGSSRKSGYKFSVNFVNGRPDTIFAGNELVQSLITALQEDDAIQQQLQKNDYTFSFTSKYQLQIKNNSQPGKDAVSELSEELQTD